MLRNTTCVHFSVHNQVARSPPTSSPVHTLPQCLACALGFSSWSPASPSTCLRWGFFLLSPSLKCCCSALPFFLLSTLSSGFRASVDIWNNHVIFESEFQFRSLSSALGDPPTGTGCWMSPVQRPLIPWPLMSGSECQQLAPLSAQAAKLENWALEAPFSHKPIRFITSLTATRSLQPCPRLCVSSRFTVSSPILRASNSSHDSSRILFQSGHSSLSKP